MHCPLCTKVLFKKGRFVGKVKFTMCCPHCKQPIIVKTIEKMVINVRRRDAGPVDKTAC